MQVKVQVGAVTLIALLDTGSSHNFIAEEAARRTNLAVQAKPRLTATVANGEKLQCAGVLRQAPITIAGEDFQVDLFVLPLAGYDLVLGTQWMVTLGPITWDFQARTMSFARQDRVVCWSDVPARPAPSLATNAVAADLLGELLDSFQGVFAEPSGLPPQRGRDHAIVLKPGGTAGGRATLPLPRRPQG